MKKPPLKEALDRYLETEGRVKENGRFFLAFAVGVAALQMTRVPSAGYRPLVVILPWITFRYSVFADLFLLLALNRFAAASPTEGMRVFAHAGAGLYLAHALTSFGDNLGLLGTPALLEAAAFWYPSVLALLFLSRIRSGTGYLLETGGLVMTVLVSLSLLSLNLAGLFYSLLPLPGFRNFAMQAILLAGVGLGGMLFAGGLLQALLFLYLYLRRASTEKDYRRLGTMVYLDKKRKI